MLLVHAWKKKKEKRFQRPEKNSHPPQVRAALVTLTYLAGNFHGNAEGYKTLLSNSV